MSKIKIQSLLLILVFRRRQEGDEGGFSCCFGKKKKKNTRNGFSLGFYTIKVGAFYYTLALEFSLIADMIAGMYAKYCLKKEQE